MARNQASGRNCASAIDFELLATNRRWESETSRARTAWRFSAVTSRRVTRDSKASALVGAPKNRTGRPNGPALSCRPPVDHYATTDGRPASPPGTRAAGGWEPGQAEQRRPVSCSALLGRRLPPPAHGGVEE